MTLPRLAALLFLCAALSLSCAAAGDGAAESVSVSRAPTAAGAPAPDGLARATFAGGCFWCMEPPFDGLEGVASVRSGYTGGRKENPTYDEVVRGRTGHAEAVEIVFDPERIGYEELLEIFWRNIDPTTPDRQFCDVGSQYRSEIFVHDAEQRRLAEESKRRIDASGRLPGPVVTRITDADTFWPAEEYHQQYYRKNPVRYTLYRRGCGRDARLRELWGEPSSR